MRRVLLAALLAVVLVVALTVIVKARFIINDELNLVVSPGAVSLSLVDGESATVALEAQNRNFLQCTSACTARLVDLEDGRTVAAEELELRHNEERAFQYGLAAPLTGEGQRLYRWELTCTNQRTLVCPTLEEERDVRVLLTLNHRLTEEDAAAKAAAQPALDAAAQLLEEANVLLGETGIVAERLGTHGPALSGLAANVSAAERRYAAAADAWRREAYARITPPDTDALARTVAALAAANRDALRLLALRAEAVDALNAVDRDAVRARADGIAANGTRTERDALLGLLNRRHDALLKARYEASIPETRDEAVAAAAALDAHLASPLAPCDANATCGAPLDPGHVDALLDEPLPGVNTTLPVVTATPRAVEPHPSRCCVDGCRPCGEAAVPVLFIHGHAFNDANTPEYTMRSFARLQALFDEEGWLDAGELVLTDDVPDGDWGRAGVPVAARATYYYIADYDLGAARLELQRRERIENYALRLRELVEALSARTGADRVDLVAHSMGGLVAREYLALFGTEHVRTVVLVNTPNQGVSARVSRLCNVFGADKECEDLAAESVFLARLNAQPLPDVELHAVRSVGCDTDGLAGDGIVAATSAALDGAENHLIEGRCTDGAGTSLHTDVLDPGRNPALARLLLGILR